MATVSEWSPGNVGDKRDAITDWMGYESSGSGYAKPRLTA